MENMMQAILFGIIFILLSVFFFMQIRRAYTEGEISTQRHHYRRDQEPFGYWSTFIALIFAGIGMNGFILYMIINVLTGR